MSSMIEEQLVHGKTSSLRVGGSFPSVVIRSLSCIAAGSVGFITCVAIMEHLCVRMTGHANAQDAASCFHVHRCPLSRTICAFPNGG